MSTTKEQTTENENRVLAVDWDRAEKEAGKTYDEDARDRIEYGNISPSPGDDKRNSRHPIYANAQFVHPNAGPLSPVYVPYSSRSFFIPAFRSANGYNPIRDFQDMRNEGVFDLDLFCSIVPELEQAAKELTEAYDGWYEGRHPIVEADGRESGPLDAVFIRCAIPDMESIDPLPIGELSITISSILEWDTEQDGHYTLIFKYDDFHRHVPRYPSGPVSRYADHAGLLDIYNGPRSFWKPGVEDLWVFDNTEELPDHINIQPDFFYWGESYFGDLNGPLPALASRARYYAYQRDDGSYLSTLRWWESATRNKVRSEPLHTHVYLFEGEVSPSKVEAALLIDRHQYDERLGDVFERRGPQTDLNHRLMDLSRGEMVNLKFGANTVRATVSEPAEYRSPEIVDDSYKLGGFMMRFTPIESDWWSWMDDSWKVSDITVTAEKRREWTLARGWVTRFPTSKSEKTVPLGGVWNVEPVSEGDPL